jgi:hypothetical protein
LNGIDNLTPVKHRQLSVSDFYARCEIVVQVKLAGHPAEELKKYNELKMAKTPEGMKTQMTCGTKYVG